MAPPSDLRVIGLEGSALVDRFFGAPAPRRSIAKNGVYPARQGHWVVQVPYDEMEEPPINSREVAARYGGITVVSHRKGKPQTRVG